MNRCIVCKNEKWFKYCTISNKKYNVLICEKCSFTKLNPLPTQEELNSFYSNQYREKFSSQNYVDDSVVNYEQQRADRIVDVIKDDFNINYKYILDIGCSSGTLLKTISNLSANITPSSIYGIEMNDNYRDYILNSGLSIKKNITNENIENFYIGKENMFDFISLVHVLEHLHNPRKALEAIQKLLNKDGLFYIEVPNLKTPYSNLTKNYFAIYHLYYFSEKSLRFLLEDVGFSIVEEKQIAGTSICFVCKKNTFNNIPVREKYNNEFESIVRTLQKYEKKYPLLVLKQQVIGLLDLIGFKKPIKSVLSMLSK